MKTSKYLAVFHSLSYAGQIRNRFWSAEKPEIIKTPKSIAKGCSYSLMFSEAQLSKMRRLISERKKGFLGIYCQNTRGQYEECSDDISG